MKSLAMAGIFFHNALFKPTEHYLSFSELASKVSVLTSCFKEYIYEKYDNCKSHKHCIGHRVIAPSLCDRNDIVVTLW